MVEKKNKSATGMRLVAFIIALGSLVIIVWALANGLYHPEMTGGIVGFIVAMIMAQYFGGERKPWDV